MPKPNNTQRDPKDLKDLNKLIDQKMGNLPIKVKYGASWGIFVFLAYLIVFFTVLLVLNNGLGNKLYVLGHGAWKEAIQSFLSLIPLLLGAMVVIIILLILLVFIGKVALTIIRSNPAFGLKHTWYLGVVLLSLVGGGTWIVLATEQWSKILWEYEVEGPIRTSPAIGTDNNIYFVSNDKLLPKDELLYSINRSGMYRWDHELDLTEKVDAFPVIGSDNTIYSGSKDTVYAFDYGGKFKWKFGIPDKRKNKKLVPTPAIGPDGTIYYLCNINPFLATRFFRLYALTPTGELKWDYKSDAGFEVDMAPSIGRNGTIYFSTSELVGLHKYTYIFAISDSGQFKWKYPEKDPITERIETSIAIDGDGNIYFGCDDHHLYAVSSEGKLKWKYKTGAPVRSTPAIGKDGTIYFGSDDHNLYAIAPDGPDSFDPKWKYPTGGAIRSSPLIASNGIIYFGSDDHHLYGVSLKGKLKFDELIGGRLQSSPVISDEGILYIGSSNKTLYAISPTRRKLSTADTPWPEFGYDVRNTGCPSSK